MPLPISSIAEERSTALGSVMSAPLDRADLDEADRRGVRSGLGAGNQQALGAPPPEIVDDDIDPCGELLLEGVFQRRLVLDERDRHIGPERRDRSQGVGIAAGGDDLLRPEMLGDLHREAAGRAGRAVDQHGFSAA